MPTIRVSDRDRKQINKIVKIRNKYSPYIHTQSSVVHDAIKLLKENDANILKEKD